jgi:hypothetical protein
MKLEWIEDEGGDWKLKVDGRYFGMVCPHLDRFRYPVAIWGTDRHECADTVDECKQILMNQARNENEKPRHYPEC